MSHTLLLADDSTTIQRVVELTFANEDIDVVTVGDGTRAIEAIERDEPDIVLVDVSMPGRDGYEVASFVRSDPARDRIPVVLLTGAFEPLDKSRCEAIGRHEVLVKPFEPRHVVGKVRELLDLPSTDAGGALEGVTPDTPAVEAGTAVEAAPAEESAAEPAAAPAEAVPVEQLAAGPSEPPAASADETAAEGSEPVAPLSAEEAPGVGGRVPPAGAGGSVLAQSFVTFLAVEQGADPPAVATADTGADSGSTGPALQVTDAMMDELVDRVVARMTETVLRDAVAEVVSRIAERLAREATTRVTSGGE